MPRRANVQISKRDLAYQQMRLPLDELLDAHPDELIPLDIGVDDIGGELLSILSTGLYTNPLDCIREYVQNAVDANASTATIKITGNSVHVFDNGDGMSLDEIVQARQFGLSMKSLSQHVGFRGIGIYSSFHLCNQLRVTSKKAGEKYQHILVFEFGAMKAELDQNKQRDTHERKITLVELLSAHTKISRSRHTLPEDAHFTHVEMQEISDVHIKKLGNREELKHYMIRNLPIDFDESFEHKDQINQQLHLEVSGYNAIMLILQTDGLPDIVVTKPSIPFLQPPVMGPIISGTGKNARKIGYYWACLNAERDHIAANARYDPRVLKNRDILKAIQEEFRAYEGFVYKMRGFTIGNRDRLRYCFSPKVQLYPWYTGEIYVLDTSVIPKADRDDFETNEAKRALDIAVMQQLSALEDAAESFQATGVADERVEKYSREVARIESEVEANTQESDFETYTQLNDILKDLRRQEKKASPKNQPIARDLIKLAERLQKRLANETETSQTEAARRKRAAKEEKPSPLAQQIPTDTLATFSQERLIQLESSSPIETISYASQNTLVFQHPRDEKYASSDIMPTTSNMVEMSQHSSPSVTLSLQLSRTLSQVLLEAGWSLDGDCKRLVTLLEVTLENIVLDKLLYQSILADFEDRLNNDLPASV